MSGDEIVQESSEGLLEQLHRRNPYAGFPLDRWPQDLQGWGSKHRLIRLMIEQVRPRLIVEVGSWKGGSAVHMADEARRLGLDTTILCIDTWLGSPGTYLRRDHTYDSLNFRHGYPRLYFQFIANVLHSGHQETIVPLAQTSDNAIEILRGLGVRPSLVYLDAAHEYEAVKKDISNYFSILADDGVMIGDDFNRRRWPGVVRAAEEYAAESALELFVDSPKFLLGRRDLAQLELPAPARS